MIEKTLLLIKPNATKKNAIGAILKMIEDNEFEITKLKMFRMDNELADKFYAEHIGKSFYETLKSFMLSGNIVGAVLIREDAIIKLRELVGNTNPEKAALGTIRYLFADSFTENAVHASDSSQSAKREIGLIFPE
ncbi:MAG TPA: nucleoside-diphosphate kinase [Candidatus Cloacimonetes bacterium]|nr:nucleoside-diphosphate kinase [Candidatus Cloacimonadota bacterium]HEX38267.1 nucleoside-diphosphate kinase [Candidatus Cloacimonadota bacterium]